MKKIFVLAVAALLAAKVLAGGLLTSDEIPVLMVIDKTVTISVSPAQITLVPIDEDTGNSVFGGFATVTVTHNFPVIVTSVIVPVGPSLGAAAIYQVSVTNAPAALPQTAAQWLANTGADDILPLDNPAPAPTGEIFYVGAAVCNGDFSFVPSSTTPIQVATVALTVSDNL